LIEDTPTPGFDLPSCLSKAIWRGQKPEECNFKYYLDSTMQSFYKKQNISVINVSDLLCSNNLCSPIIDGIITYRDSHHITATLSEALYDDIEAKFKESSFDFMSLHNLK
jgi:hypothetical protein